MEKKDKILEWQKQMMDFAVPFDKLPSDLREMTFEYLSFRRELGKESDRGCALLAAAHLDIMLEKLLRKILIGSKKQFEFLFGFNGPLGTFSSRILLCYSIGLLSSESLHDIQIIRKIRNEFAHSSSVIEFGNKKIKLLCDSLKLNVHLDDALPRAKFLNVVSGLSGQIWAKTHVSNKFKTEVEIDLEMRKNAFDKIIGSIKESI